MEQRHLSERDSKLMIGAQMNMDKKAAMAQFVIENSGSLQDTHEQVLRIHGNLSKSFFHWKVRLLLGAAIGGLFGIAYLVSKKIVEMQPEDFPTLMWKKPSLMNFHKIDSAR